MGYDALPLVSFVLLRTRQITGPVVNFQKVEISRRASPWAYSPRPHGGWAAKHLPAMRLDSNSRRFQQGLRSRWNAIANTFDANPSRRIGVRRFKKRLPVPLAYDDAAHVPHKRHQKIPTCGPVDNCVNPAEQVFFQPPPPAASSPPKPGDSPGESISR